MPMDATAYWEQRNQQNAEKRYELDLERAATGERQLASMVGSEKAKDAFSSGLTALARGGPAEGRRPYLVGEKGPELMVPDQDGTIIPNHKLQVLARALKKRAVPRAKGGGVIAGGEPERSFGFRSGAARGAPEARAADLAVAGNELGAPTSFNAGAGAPVPVEVVRGTRTTYTNPAPDMGEGGGYNPTLSRNTREFASPVQAGQAYNRGELNQDLALAKILGVTPNVGALKEKYGEYVPKEGPLEDIKGKYHVEGAAAYNKRPDLVQAAEKAAKDEATNAALGAVKSHLVEVHGTTVDGKRVFKPKDEGMQVDAIAAEQHARATGDGEAGKRVFSERQAIRDYLVKNPQKIPIGYDVNRYMGQMAQDPAAWQVRLEEARSGQPVGKSGGVISPGKWYEYQKKPTDLMPAWMKPPASVPKGM